MADTIYGDEAIAITQEELMKLSDEEIRIVQKLEEIREITQGMVNGDPEERTNGRSNPLLNFFKRIL